ncbi:MAG: hypothetical protein ABR980_11980 [Ignavibacteriaceae bacterium]|jgi:hypothetical protein
MPRTTSLIIESSLLNKVQIKESVFVLAFSILIPFLIHFIPVSGNPAGAVLLPIFIAPFIAVVFFRLNVAIIAALLSPVLNYLLTGNPVYGTVGIITLELVLFVFIAWLLIKLKFVKYFAAPVSVIISMFVTQLIFSSVSHFAVVLTRGLPGIILISLMNILIFTLAKKSK